MKGENIVTDDEMKAFEERKKKAKGWNEQAEQVSQQVMSEKLAEDNNKKDDTNE